MNRLRGPSRGAFFSQLERLFGQGTSFGSTEGELLERFVAEHDEVAFEALVARHGPMVLGVCRQLLRDPNDVDDAFQATFLVLVRKAATLRQRDLLGNWLYGVAYRVAARARSLSARRNARVTSGHDSVESLSNVECGEDGDLNQTMVLDQGPGLHREVSYLPEKYRIPIVLCYFEGLTHDEAASRLGWPLGTVKGRLARARGLLRRRLIRRGVALSATALCSHLAGLEAKAAVPASLRLMTVNGARALACEAGVSLARSSGVSLPVSALVEGVLHTMIANQIKSIALASLLALGAVSTGVIVGATQLSGGSANAGKANQIHAGLPDSSNPGVSGTGAQAAVRNTGAATPPVSPQLAQQLSATRASFSQLLSTFRELQLQDIDRLSKWSIRTLEADLVFGTSDVDRVAAYEGHRDRMKRLRDVTRKIPVSDKDQPDKVDRAQTILAQAELWLENSRQGQIQTTPLLKSETVAPKSDAHVANADEDSADKQTIAKPVQEQKKGTGRIGGARIPGIGGGMGGMSVGMGGGMGGMGGGMGGMGGGMGGMGGGMGGMMGGLSQEDMSRQLRWMNAATAAGLASRDANPQTRAILKKLEETVSMSFGEDTALDEVLKYIRQATSTKNSATIPIYVDPKGLKDADATLQSLIRLDLEGVPLKTTFRLMLKQIGLAYCVRDGVLIISSVQGINDELREAQREIDATDPPEGRAGFGGGGGFQ